MRSRSQSSEAEEFPLKISTESLSHWWSVKQPFYPDSDRNIFTKLAWRVDGSKTARVESRNPQDKLIKRSFVVFRTCWTWQSVPCKDWSHRYSALLEGVIAFLKKPYLDLRRRVAAREQPSTDNCIPCDLCYTKGRVFGRDRSEAPVSSYRSLRHRVRLSTTVRHSERPSGPARWICKVWRSWIR